MKVSDRAIDFLVGLVTGNELGGYRSGPALVDFFNSLGEEDLYGQGFPSRHVYVRDKLQSFNGSDRIKPLIEKALGNSFGDDEGAAENAAFQLSRLISAGGYKIKKNYDKGFYHNGEYIDGPMFFEVVRNAQLIQPVSKILLTDASLAEHIHKSRDRLEKRDFSGAISICYTIVEEFLKLSLKEESVKFKDEEGDIRRLYKLYSSSRSMNITEETPEPLKPLLSGLTTLIGGFYYVANKASDRHAAKYRADSHHARLVINLTLCFCEFLLESRGKQNQS
ncbi:MAG: abortive infection family protein [Pararhodobacter sp.]|nr:abortive infection family protein [Pararhodobacter sp.]